MSTMGWILLCATVAPGASWWRAGRRDLAAAFALLHTPGFVVVGFLAYAPHGGSLLAVAAIALQLVFLAQSVLGALAVRRATSREPWSTTMVFLGVVLIASVTSRWLPLKPAEPFSIPSNSMAPSLVVGDQVMVAKWGTRSRERGAVIVFKSPESNEFSYVKRVIGVEGDSIAIQEGRLSINGVEVAREPCEEANCEVERFDGKRWRITKADGAASDGTWTVPAGNVFVLGDNRANSQDSRHFGPVPIENILGVARDIHFSWPQLSRAFQSIDPQ